MVYKRTKLKKIHKIINENDNRAITALERSVAKQSATGDLNRNSKQTGGRQKGGMQESELKASVQQRQNIQYNLR